MWVPDIFQVFAYGGKKMKKVISARPKKSGHKRKDKKKDKVVVTKAPEAIKG